MKTRDRKDEFWKAVFQLENHHGIFYHLVRMGEPRFTTSASTAGVTWDEREERILFVFNPYLWDRLDTYQRTFVLCHEALHIILKHPRRFGHILDEDDPRQKKAAVNVSADCVINELLIKKFGFNRARLQEDLKGVGLPPVCWFDSTFPDKPIRRDLNFEHYFLKLYDPDDQTTKKDLDRSDEVEEDLLSSPVDPPSPDEEGEETDQTDREGQTTDEGKDRRERTHSPSESSSREDPEDDPRHSPGRDTPDRSDQKEPRQPGEEGGREGDKDPAEADEPDDDPTSSDSSEPGPTETDDSNDSQTEDTGSEPNPDEKPEGPTGPSGSGSDSSGGDAGEPERSSPDNRRDDENVEREDGPRLPEDRQGGWDDHSGIQDIPENILDKAAESAEDEISEQEKREIDRTIDKRNQPVDREEYSPPDIEGIDWGAGNISIGDETEYTFDIDADQSRDQLWREMIDTWKRKAVSRPGGYTWKRRNRRTRNSLKHERIRVPAGSRKSEDQDRPSAFIFLDTSGSCKSHAREILEITATVPRDKIDLQVFGFDTELYEVDLDDPKLRGFGGTRYDILEAKIQQMIKDSPVDGYPSAVFVITDGKPFDTVSPERPKRWHFLLVGDFKTEDLPAGASAYDFSEDE